MVLYEQGMGSRTAPGDLGMAGDFHFYYLGVVAQSIGLGRE
jgi:hypothetical protein